MSDILNRLIEKVENRYYGKYRATVTDNLDPKNLGRIKLKVPELLGDDNETGWALPCLPYGGFNESGFFFIPEINSNVWVEFEGGNLSYPIWTGTWWGESSNKNISEAKVDPDNNVKVLKTRSGHKIEFSDKDHKEKISIKSSGKHEFLLNDADGDQKIQLKSTKGHSILIDDANEKIEITSVGGHSILIDDKGKKIEIKTSNGSKISMDDSFLVLGKITIKDPAGSSIELNGEDGSISIESNTSLSIKGVDVTIEASGMMTVKAGGILTLQGSLIKLN